MEMKKRSCTSIHKAEQEKLGNVHRKLRQREWERHG